MHWTHVTTPFLCAALACNAPAPATSAAPVAVPAPAPATVQAAPERPEPPPAPAAPQPTPAPPATMRASLVFAAALAPEGGAWEVVSDGTGSIDLTALGKRLEALQIAEEEPVIDRFEPGDPRLPAGLAHGDPWTLITLAGSEQRTARGFSAYISEGSSSLHFAVDLGPPLPGARGPALAMRGHGPTTASFVVPAPLAPAALGPKTLRRVIDALLPKLEPELREHARKLKFVDPQIKLYPGRFPGGRTHVVFVQAEPPPDSEDGIEVSAVLFARADGSVEFYRPAVVWGHASLFGLIDVEGDGLDEVIYEDQYHEGWYLEMIAWEGDRPAGRTLTGDGI